MLSSWTAPLSGLEEIDKIINEEEAYLIRIDKAVKENYTEKEDTAFTACKKTLDSLGLPAFLANNVVDRAFLSHLSRFA